MLAYRPLFLRMKRKRILVVLLENVHSILFEALRVFMTELLKKKIKQNKTKTKEKRSGDGECDEL